MFIPATKTWPHFPKILAVSDLNKVSNNILHNYIQSKYSTAFCNMNSEYQMNYILLFNLVINFFYKTTTVQ